jgi:transcriptional regulator with XRE-family HTH domain
MSVVEAIMEKLLLTLALVTTNMAHGEAVRSPAESAAVPGSGFVAVLGVRLREIRQAAGLSQEELAHMIGQEPSYRAHLSQLERGQVPSPSLVLVADYLRACRASFADLGAVLGGYTDRPPVREPRVRELVAAELAPLGGREAARLMVYDRKVGESQKPEARVRATRKQARAAAERRLLDRLMMDEVNRLGVKPTMLVRKVALDYARMVWKALKLTTASQKAEAKTVKARGGRKCGRPRKTREQRLADARARFLDLAPGVLPDRALEQIEARVAALYEDVHRFEKPGQ